MRKTIWVIVLFLAAASLGAESREVTAKQMEVFGPEMVGQNVCMTGEFKEISQTWPDMYDLSEAMIGFFMDDSEGDLFQFAVADKATFAKTLFQFRKGDTIRACGKIEAHSPNRVVSPKPFLVADQIIRLQ